MGPGAICCNAFKFAPGLRKSDKADKGLFTFCENIDIASLVVRVNKFRKRFTVSVCNRSRSTSILPHMDSSGLPPGDFYVPEKLYEDPQVTLYTDFRMEIREDQDEPDSRPTTRCIP